MRVVMLRICEQDLWGSQELNLPPNYRSTKINECYHENTEEIRDWLRYNLENYTLTIDKKSERNLIMDRWEHHYIIDIPNDIALAYKMRFPEIKTVDMFI